MSKVAALPCSRVFLAAVGLLAAGCGVAGSDNKLVVIETPSLAETPGADVPLIDPGPAADPEPEPAPATCGDEPLPLPESALIAMDGALSTLLDPCTGATHATAGPRGAALTVELDDWDGDAPAVLWVEDLSGVLMAGPTVVEPGDALDFTLTQPGEVLIRLEPVTPSVTDRTPYMLSVACTDGCDADFTRYPMVLMHGMAGSDAWLGVIDYFVDVEDTLDAAGFIGIAPGVDAFNDIPARASQWQAHLDDLEAAGVGRRFILIGHSQGGLDARYLASTLEDDRVAAIVSIGTPHRGTPIADLGVGLLEGVPGLSWAVDAAIDLFAQLIGLGEAEFTAQVSDLSEAAAADFNAAVPDVEGVYMASWAGRTCARIDVECRLENDNEIADTVFDLTTLVLNEVAGDNDGLIPVDSAIWGDFQGVLPADHIDQVGLTDPLTTAPLDHRAFFVEEAQRLGALGL